MNRHKYSLLAALILSGLVHALFFIFSSDASLSNDVSHSSSVVIQLELLKSAEQVDVINRDVVISASDLSAHISSQLNDQQLVQPVNPSESIELEPDVKNESLAVMPSDEQSNESVHHEKLENNLNQLLELVYQEINREKRYPYLAKRQRREGLVKLSFVLHPCFHCLPSKPPKHALHCSLWSHLGLQ